MSTADRPGSAGTRRSRRPRLPWPADREFRIFSIDGGGIWGIFPAAVLAGLEERFLGGAGVAGYFDLIAGTSTGGILALGLGAGLSAATLRNLYVDRGCEIFPPLGPGIIGRVRRRFRATRRYTRYIYDQDALADVLREKLGDRLFGSSARRLCIPSFEGVYGEGYIFRTPHHPDFKKDWREPMLKVALATSAAPSYYRPLRSDGYTYVDGGVSANNPVMIALVEALASFDLTREQIRILSIGCGETPLQRHGPKAHAGWSGSMAGYHQRRHASAIAERAGSARIADRPGRAAAGGRREGRAGDRTRRLAYRGRVAALGSNARGRNRRAARCQSFSAGARRGVLTSRSHEC